MAQQSARLMGAERVIAIDRFPERLRMAREHAGSEMIDYTQVDSVLETLNKMPGGRGSAPASTGSAWRRTGRACSTLTTAPSTLCAWRRTAAKRCARPSWPAARAARYRCSAFTG